MEKHTPIFAIYGTDPKVKMIDFGGWGMPVDFGDGIIPEHNAVRCDAGLFDVSHMGECYVKGRDAAAYLSWICTNHISTMQDGQCMYTLMCYENGTVVDDLLVYRINGASYLLILNASNTEKDLAWLQGHTAGYSVVVEDASSSFAQLALQGPKAVEILIQLVPDCADMKGFTFRQDVNVGGIDCLVSRTGYTGEDGYELYCASTDGCALWKLLLEKGKPYGLVPCGLGSRDTLRIEAKLPLYGHEISDTITPLEANLGVFVDLEKDDFCGKAALSKQKAEGIPRSLRGVKMVDGGVPRAGYKVFHGTEEIGYVTSGTKSPTLDAFIAYVLVKRDTGLVFGDTVDVEIHGKLRKAELVRTPFYKHVR
jgi:aminomethyltransferase